MAKLRSQTRKEQKLDRLQWIVDRLNSRKNWITEKKYPLLVRKSHRTPADHHEYQEFPGQGLLTRTTHWERVGDQRGEHQRYISFPSKFEKDFIPSNKVAIEDLKEPDDFKEWFEYKFPDLQDGVYGAIQNQGKGHGTCLLFLLKYENAEVIEWRAKSRRQKWKGVGESAQYYIFPLLFYLRKKYDV